MRPFAAARCDGDKVFLFNDITKPIQLGMALHYLDPVTADVLGKQPYKGPLAVGHECIAEVVTCGNEVVDFKPGDKVIVPLEIFLASVIHHGIT